MSVQTTCCRSAPEFVRCWRGRSPPACLDSRACWGPAGRISSAPQRVSGYVAHDVAHELRQFTHMLTHPLGDHCVTSLCMCVQTNVKSIFLMRLCKCEFMHSEEHSESYYRLYNVSLNADLLCLFYSRLQACCVEGLSAGCAALWATTGAAYYLRQPA